MKLAFASDFDNTLYFKDSFKNTDLIQIKEFQNHNNLFGISTGRSLNGLLSPCKGKIDFDFYIVCSGSLILDKNLNIVYKQTIQKDDFSLLYSLLGEKYALCFVTIKDFMVIKGKENPSIYTPCREINSVKEINEEIFGISFLTGSEEEATKLKIKIESNIDTITAHQNKAFLDLTRRGCSKGNAINLVKKLLHIDKIAAMGDSYNDITMLQEADVPYTFNTAPNEVQMKAHYLKDSIKDALIHFEKLF